MGLIAHLLLIPTIVLVSVAVISSIYFFRQRNVFNNQVIPLPSTTESIANFVPIRQCNCQTLPNCPYYRDSGMTVRENEVQKCGFDTSTFSVQICCPPSPQKPPDPNPTTPHQSHSHKPVQSPPAIKTSTSTTEMYNRNETIEEDYPDPNIDIRSTVSGHPTNQVTVEMNEQEIPKPTTDQPEDVQTDEKNISESVSILVQLEKNSKLGLHENFKLLPRSTEECGTPDNLPLLDIKRKRRKKRVVGGKNASLTTYPWIVRIFYSNTGSQEICFGCLGTVLNEKYVLTSVHCVQKPLNTITVVAGEGENTKMFNAEEIVAHSRYNNMTKHHDIALIRVTENISFGGTPFMYPVCLPFFEAYNLSLDDELTNSQNNEVVVAGWGVSNISDMSTIGNELKDAVVPEWPITECQNVYDRHNRNRTIIVQQFCTGAGKTKADACWGDSGGGIYSLKSKLQVGIVSYGFPSPFKCGHFPGVNTRIIFYLKWILDSIRP